MKERKNRDDKTAIELWVAGIFGWDAEVQRFLIPDLDSDRPQRRSSAAAVALSHSEFSETRFAAAVFGRILFGGSLSE